MGGSVPAGEAQHDGTAQPSVFITDINIEWPAANIDATHAHIQYQTKPGQSSPATHRQLTVGPFAKAEGHRLIAIELDDEMVSAALGQLEAALQREATP